MSVNKVILIGRLGAEPEMRYTPAGNPVATFNIATNEWFMGRSGDRQERTEWHRVVAWDRLAELAHEHLHKGSRIYTEGRIQSRSWDKQGKKQYMTEIIARDIHFLDSKNHLSPLESLRPVIGETTASPVAMESHADPVAEAAIPF